MNAIYRIEEIMKKTGGFPQGSLNVIAGRPGTGKTYWALHWALFFASLHQYRGKILFISLEMKKNVLEEKIRYYTRSANSLLRSKDNKTVSQQFTKNFDPLFLWDAPEEADISAIIEKIEMYKGTKDIKIVFIDYIQLMLNRETDNEGIVIQALKEFAVKSELVIITTTQLRRTKGNINPGLSQLKYSDVYMKNMDRIIFLRPDKIKNKLEYEIITTELD